MTSLTTIRRKIQSSPNQTIADIAPIIVEATVSETHAAQADVARAPVEAGFDVTDAIHYNGLALQIEVAFSDQPLGGDIAGDGIFSGTDSTRKSAAWDRFLDLIQGRPYKNGQPAYSMLRIDTGLKQYDNMIITSVGTGQNVANHNGISVSLQLQQIRTVSSLEETIEAVPPAALEEGEVRDRATQTVDAGDQVAEDLGDFGFYCRSNSGEKYAIKSNPDYDPEQPISDDNPQYFVDEDSPLAEIDNNPAQPELFARLCQNASTNGATPASLVIDDRGL